MRLQKRSVYRPTLKSKSYKGGLKCEVARSQAFSLCYDSQMKSGIITTRAVASTRYLLMYQYNLLIFY